MDIEKALRELYAERTRITKQIAMLEGLAQNGESAMRKRRPMTPEERLAVSRRMSAYWADRRPGGQSNGNENGNGNKK